MESPINIYTEASDQRFHLVRTSVFSFIKTNPWFNGTLNLLTHPTLPISNKNLDFLLSIYPNIVVKSGEDHPIFKSIERYRDKNQYADLVNSALKWTIFNSAEKDEHKLYFSNLIIFQSDCSQIFKENIGKPRESSSLIYLNKNIEIPENLYSSLTQIALTPLSLESTLNHYLNSENSPIFYSNEIFLFSNEHPDSKFIVSRNTLMSKKIIFFNTLDSYVQYSKINQIWLFKNKESNQFLMSPSSFKLRKNLTENNKHLKKENNSASLKPNEIKNIVFSSTPNLIPLRAFKEYLSNKKIAIVANSSELLDNEYGELIDSHDVVIRFNGYPIFPIHTGIKTSIHCIFRQARFNLENESNYLIVLSKPMDLWQKAINEISFNYPNKKILNYNYPNSSILTKALNKNYVLPTSGLSIILLLKELNVINSEIRLFGFNGYSSGKSSILRSNSDKNISNVHQYRLELEYISREFELEKSGIFKKIIKNENSLPL